MLNNGQYAPLSIRSRPGRHRPPRSYLTGVLSSYSPLHGPVSGITLLTTSITTTVQGGMSGDVRRAARRLAWERLARSLHSCVSSSQRSSSFGPNRSRGSISRTTR